MTTPKPTAPIERHTHNGVTYVVTRDATGQAVAMKRDAGQPPSPFTEKLERIALNVLRDVDARKRARDAARLAETARPPSRAEAVAPIMRMWSKAAATLEATADQPADSNATQWRTPPGVVTKTTPGTLNGPPVSITTEVRGALRKPQRERERAAPPREPGDDTAHEAAAAAEPPEVHITQCAACKALLAGTLTGVCPSCGAKDGGR